MYFRHERGKKGERIAHAYYTSRGFVLIEHNVRCSFGELDLVLLKSGIVHFVEVKFRTTTTFGYPEESVVPEKIQRVYRCAEHFLSVHSEWQDHERRFEVCSILQHQRRTIIRIYPA